MANPNVVGPLAKGGAGSEKWRQPAPTLSPKPFDERLQKALDKALYAGGRRGAQQFRNFLNGTWLGEPLHAVLKDLPIGAWTMAMIFDALALNRSRREFARAADTAMAIGVAGAACAAVAGAADWSDVGPQVRRTGLIHGLLNLGATALFATSWVLRKKEVRTGGRVTAALGYSIMVFSAHLGGRMVYEHRVGVDQTGGQVFPEEFTAVLPEAELTNDKPTRVDYKGTPILLVRRGERIFAMAETCSHFSGPLSQGHLVDDSIVCPYHYSRFALEDGHVINGPAVHPQPCLEVRVSSGQVEVRKTRAA